MNSIDTNILLYAINRDCPEHGAAIGLVRRALAEPSSWIVADQVWFELYRLLRNPSVLGAPLSAADAAETIEWYRGRSGWLTCAWEPDLMPRLSAVWRRSAFSARSTFDAVLAVTLKAHGVRTLYTRNSRDFRTMDLFEVSDPIELRETAHRDGISPDRA